MACHLTVLISWNIAKVARPWSATFGRSVTDGFAKLVYFMDVEPVKDDKPGFAALQKSPVPCQLYGPSPAL